MYSQGDWCLCTSVKSQSGFYRCARVYVVKAVATGVRGSTYSQSDVTVVLECTCSQSGSCRCAQVTLTLTVHIQYKYSQIGCFCCASVCTVGDCCRGLLSAYASVRAVKAVITMWVSQSSCCRCARRYDGVSRGCVPVIYSLNDFFPMRANVRTVKAVVVGVRPRVPLHGGTARQSLHYRALHYRARRPPLQLPPGLPRRRYLGHVTHALYNTSDIMEQ